MLTRIARSRWTVLAVGLLLGELVHLGFQTVDYVWRVHPSQAPTAARLTVPLEPTTIDPEWILEGAPTFRARLFSRSADGLSVSGIWECEGPSRFLWRYDIDETVYVLEGEVDVEYGGAVHKLRPGDTAFFPAGTTAVWKVPDRVRKTFTLNQPGRLRRWLRRLL